MKYFLIALLSIFIGSAAAAELDSPWPGAVRLSRVDELRVLREAVRFSRYDIPWVARPEIYMTPEALFKIEACGARAFTESCTAIGVTLYAPPHRIYISDELLSQPEAQFLESIYLHEVVHWLQMTGGWAQDPDNCVAIYAHEVEAYSAQYIYLVMVQHYSKSFWMPPMNCTVPAEVAQ